VVLTAPIPGVRTPSFPFGGAILTGLRIRFSPRILAVSDALLCFPKPIASERKNYPRQRAVWSKVKHDAASRAHLQFESRNARACNSAEAEAGMV
jgi:hypothetical protein